MAVTPQRIAIYRALLEANDHPNPEAIYTRVRSTMPSLSQALRERVAGPGGGTGYGRAAREERKPKDTPGLSGVRAACAGVGMGARMPIAECGDALSARVEPLRPFGSGG